MPTPPKHLPEEGSKPSPAPSAAPNAATDGVDSTKPEEPPSSLDPELARRLVVPPQSALDSVAPPDRFPSPSSPAGIAYSRIWRPRIEALKFVPGYRREWRRLEARWGGEYLRAALIAMRVDMLKATDRVKKTPAVWKALHKLTVWIHGLDIGPVDPTNADDPGLPPRPVVWAVDPFSFLGSGAVDVRFEVKGFVPPPIQSDPTLLAVIDLSYPDTEIKLDIERIRATFGVVATRRPARSLDWEDLKVAFAMLREREEDPPPTWTDLAVRHVKGGERTQDPKLAARHAMRVVKVARSCIEMMTEAHTRSRTRGPGVYKIAPPPGPICRTTF